MLRLSVLDQSTVVTGRSPDTSIRESLVLAKHCEALGYTRYWCAEHHNSASQAGTAPEILISAIAATTTRIRVGSAGVMLPHYSSLKVAEQFRVLEAIAPGRIDLGLGRAPGSDGRTAFALNPLAATAADHFPAQVRDLLAWLSGEKLVEGHPFRDIIAQPGGPTKPEVRMLGSSDYGPQVAAYFGIPFCFAHFITDGRGVEQAMALYRGNYRPSVRFPQPYGALCVWAMAAEDRSRRGPAVHVARDVAAGPGPRRVHRTAVAGRGRGPSVFRRRKAAPRAAAFTRDLWHGSGRGGEAASIGHAARRDRDRHTDDAARSGGAPSFLHVAGRGNGAGIADAACG
jgi:luciferase family oxidoreductase group 1